MTDLSHGWLVIACKGGWEDKTRKELERQTYAEGRRYECFMPWALVPRVKRGKAYQAREPMLPCYLFVSKPADVSIGDLNIGAINNTRGVMGVLSVANRGEPNVIADKDLDIVRNLLGADGIYHVPLEDDLPDLHKGDAVKLTQGSLAGFPAHFVRYKRRKKGAVAVVEVELFGRVVAAFVDPAELKVA